MDLMSRITKGAAGAALCGSTGASARPSVPVLVLLLAVLSALLPVSAVASFPSSHGFFYFKYTSLFFNAASYISFSKTYRFHNHNTTAIISKPCFKTTDA